MSRRENFGCSLINHAFNISSLCVVVRLDFAPVKVDLTYNNWSGSLYYINSKTCRMKTDGTTYNGVINFAEWSTYYSSTGSRGYWYVKPKIHVTYSNWKEVSRFVTIPVSILELRFFSYKFKVLLVLRKDLLPSKGTVTDEWVKLWKNVPKSLFLVHPCLLREQFPNTKTD